MSNGHQSPTERVLWQLIAAVIALELLSGVLPKLLVPLIVLAVLFVVVRLVLFHTRH